MHSAPATVARGDQVVPTSHPLLEHAIPELTCHVDDELAISVPKHIRDAAADNRSGHNDLNYR